jgi:hypothetical protein
MKPVFVLTTGGISSLKKAIIENWEVGSEIETIVQLKKLSPINVSSFDELINFVVAGEFRLAIKILRLPNVHHNYIFHSQQ